MKSIRKPAWAGRFYPGAPGELRTMVDGLLAAAPLQDEGRRLLGLVVPHAGYIYSGATAAAGYRLAAARTIDTVVVVAPSHGAYIRGVALYPGEAFATPLGEIEIDRELTRALAAAAPEQLHLSEEGHATDGGRPEHSLEVQLPFLQCACKTPFKLVAALFHDYSWEVCRALGDALAAVHHERMLIAASSDLYHGESYAACLRADARTLDLLQQGDGEAFCRAYEREEAQACGAGPIAALLHAGARIGATAVRLLARTNSEEATGEPSGYVVGYAAAAVEWPQA
ncbi:MAG TPA: AmmeMemoRadiSam system protein B [bacterium]|nr:AmmeMemoRadiSam system protein B [bacterium]HPR89480.1 AmmeMemoRadiSam system protein B [bacterium]